jgi:hypothetical protein
MRRRLRAATAPLGLALVLLAAAASPAAASNHLVKISEVFPGSTAHATAQFIELRMYATGENFFNGTHVFVYGPTGTLAGTYDLANAANGKNRSTYLLATSQAQTDFGVTADLTMSSASIDPAGGKACYISTFSGFADCVTWGSFSGSANTGETPAGTPFQQIGGLALDQVMARRTALGSKPCALDSGDDTDDSAADFMVQAGDPRPQPNSTIPAKIGGCARILAGGQMVWDAPPGVKDNVEFSCNGSRPYCGEFDDSADNHLTAGVGCWTYLTGKVVCPAPVNFNPSGTMTSAKLSGGDLQDKLDTDVEVPTTINGGDGGDSLFAVGSQPDTLKGGAGNDTLDAADFTTGNDTLNCGGGDDFYAVDDPPDTKQGCEHKLP